MRKGDSMETETIPVVFGVDKAYLLQSFVVMYSIMRNSHEYYYFILLADDDIEVETMELAEKLKSRYDNFCVSIRKIEDVFLEDMKLSNPRLTKATFFRLLIPNIITEYEKCIYLDSDIIVKDDLKELFRVDLDNNYLCGVKDCIVISNHETQHQKCLGIPSVKEYINAGVLVMNLKKIREDNLVLSFLEQAKKDNMYEDQDVLNKCCYGFIKTLPISYNLHYAYQGKAMVKLFDLPYSEEDFAFDWENPLILHMHGKYKPWTNIKYKGFDEWWDLARLYKSTDCYKNCKSRCQDKDIENKEIESIFRFCKEKSPIILWGYSKQGRDVCDMFLKKEITVTAFCDNNKEKWGEEYKGVIVCNPIDQIKKMPNAIWVVTCIKAYKEVYRQLEEEGINPENIIHFIYNHRGILYYLMLKKEYYKEEIKTIALCESTWEEIINGECNKMVERLLRGTCVNKERYQYLFFKYRFDLWLEASVS